MFSALDWAVEAAEAARDRWPDLPIEVIAETSHALFMDWPEEFNRTLVEFLELLR